MKPAYAPTMFISALIMCACLSMGGSCNRTVLRGEIAPGKNPVKVNETVMLRLDIPPELDDIYSVFWTAGPEGEIIYKKYSDINGNKLHNRAYKGDRSAFFTAKSIGRCEVSAFGFYKQTNPQIITRIFIVIEE